MCSACHIILLSDNYMGTGSLRWPIIEAVLKNISTHGSSLLAGHLLLFSLGLLQLQPDLSQLFLHPPQCLGALLRAVVSLLFLDPLQLAAQSLDLALQSTHRRLLKVQFLFQFPDLYYTAQIDRGNLGGSTLHDDISPPLFLSELLMHTDTTLCPLYFTTNPPPPLLDQSK